MVRRGEMVAAVLLGFAMQAGAQQTTPQPAAQSTHQSVPQTTPRRLTIQDAIALAVKNNLNVLVAGTQVDEAAGTRERRLSALLPHVSGDALANLQNRNLRAFGFSFPGTPLVVGPFSNYDFRVFADQTLVDRRATHSLKASEQQQQAAKLTYQDTRDLVVREAAGLYLDAQSFAAEVQAAESRVETSRALEKLAKDQHQAGLATAVDVLRAQVQLARDRQTVLSSRNSYLTALLNLARFLGLSPGTPIEPADRLEFHRLEVPDLDQALHTSLEARADYRSLRSQRESMVEQQKASRSRYLPTFSVSGNFGALGRNFGEMPATGLIQGTLAVTLFDRDRSGEQKEIASRVQRLSDQLADLARGIEQELRKAALDLETAENQVAVAEAALELAQRELALSEDRFRNGVADNLEVVTAQSSLASAQDDRILALARHADARMALARALGATEKNYQTYLGQPGIER
jgi:outer membrane protein TolC